MRAQLHTYTLFSRSELPASSPPGPSARPAVGLPLFFVTDQASFNCSPTYLDCMVLSGSTRYPADEILVGPSSHASGSHVLFDFFATKKGLGLSSHMCISTRLGSGWLGWGRPVPHQRCHFPNHVLGAPATCMGGGGKINQVIHSLSLPLKWNTHSKLWAAIASIWFYMYIYCWIPTTGAYHFRGHGITKNGKNLTWNALAQKLQLLS